MSVCTFLAANCPLPETAPGREYPLHIDVDKGTIFDGDADDNYSLVQFDDTGAYTDKKYGVCLEWAYYTEGRARLILAYIKAALQHTDCVEIWRLWLMDYYEYDERPVVRKSTVPIDSLTTEDIRELDEAEIWNNPNRNRPSFYCLEVTR